MNRRIAIGFLVVLLAACGSKTPRPPRVAGEPAPLLYPKVEIVYNARTELLVVGNRQLPMLGLSVTRGHSTVSIASSIDLASREQADATVVERSRLFQSAVENSLNQRPLPLNAEFAERVAAELRATGREVKLTPADMARGSPRDMEIAGYVSTPGHATVLLRIVTPYEAADLLSPFHPISQISYRIRDAAQGKIAADDISYRRGGPAYYTFDAMLKDAGGAYKGLQQQLADSASTIAGYFPAREEDE